MFEKKLSNLIINELKVAPTGSQKSAIDVIAKFLYDDNQQACCLLKGYAGTGKTLLISTLVKSLQHFRIKTELLAPTGRAAKVLSQYASKPAFTIHKKIYRQKSSSDGMGKFVLDFNKSSNTLFIVDESSMISNDSSENTTFGSGHLLDDLIEYVYNGKNCRLMLVGDTAQLPPVGLNISPALDAKVLESFGFTVFTTVLSDVVRQAQQSGILYNATAIRYNIKNRRTHEFFNINTTKYPGIERISGENLIEKISSCYDHYGESETIVITRSNKRANKFNEGIRNSILWREEELSRNDLVMIVKNNYYWKDDDKKIDFIANGDIARIVKVRRTEELYGFRFADVVIQMIDYESTEIECKIFLDTLSIEAPSFGYEENKKLFYAIQQDYLHISNKQKRWKEIRENEYFNALQVKFSYAVTCHKAQGGQWDAVFIDHGYLTQDMLGVDYLRWFYTAFTRPKTKLYLVNFDKQFFGESDND